MLNTWGYQYLHIGLALAYAEVDLQRYRNQKTAGVAPPQPSVIEPNNPIIDALYAKCDDILALLSGQDLEPIPGNIERLKAKIIVARTQRGALIGYLPTDEILNDVVRLKNDFALILSSRFFYDLSPAEARFYRKSALFGEMVAKKFNAARDDIESAGNCLALGESTACVLHLMRAMEAAIHKLAKKLRVTIKPRDTWGAILRNMDSGIKALPQATAKQQRKKDLWSECHVSLFHVKSAWRDPSMHPRRSYDVKQAHEIIASVQVFLQQLATL